MRVSIKVVEERRRQIAFLLQRSGFADLRTVCSHFKISTATARRDLAALVYENKIKRTYGGALGDFDTRFASFQQRCEEAYQVKSAMAQKALSLLKAGGTYYFDAGSSVYALAQAVANQPHQGMRIVTNSLPVAQKLGDLPHIDLYMVGGKLLSRQAALFDTISFNTLKRWNFDLAFIGAEGMNKKGIWNSEAAIIKFQQMALKQTQQGVFLIDQNKWNRVTSHMLVSWNEVDLLITDLNYQNLTGRGFTLSETQVLGV